MKLVIAWTEQIIDAPHTHPATQVMICQYGGLYVIIVNEAFGCTCLHLSFAWNNYDDIINDYDDYCFDEMTMIMMAIVTGYDYDHSDDYDGDDGVVPMQNPNSG